MANALFRKLLGPLGDALDYGALLFRRPFLFWKQIVDSKVDFSTGILFVFGTMGAWIFASEIGAQLLHYRLLPFADLQFNLPGITLTGHWLQLLMLLVVLAYLFAFWIILSTINSFTNRKIEFNKLLLLSLFFWYAGFLFTVAVLAIVGAPMLRSFFGVDAPVGRELLNQIVLSVILSIFLFWLVILIKWMANISKESVLITLLKTTCGYLITSALGLTMKIMILG